MLKFVKDEMDEDTEQFVLPKRKEPKWLENMFKERTGWGLNDVSSTSIVQNEQAEEETAEEDEDFVLIKGRDDLSQNTWF
jgi:hypothetical protein